MAGVEWIKHKGKDILWSNFRGANEQQFLDGLEKLKDEHRKLGGQTVLNIFDISDMEVALNRDLLAKAKEASAAADAMVAKKITAVVGFTGIKKTLVRLANRKDYIADDLEDAKEWLIKQV